MVSVDMDFIRQVIAWSAFAAIAAIVFFGRSEKQRWRPRVWAIVAVVAVLGIANTIPRGLGRVQPGARGVLLHLGAPTGRVIPEGVYYVTPFADTVVQVNTQTNTVSFDRAQGICKDLEPVFNDVDVTFHVNPEHVVEVYTKFRDDYVKRVVQPAVQDAIKTTTANFDAPELVTRRDDVQKMLRADLRTRLAAFGIELDAVSTTRLQYSYAYAQAAQDKVAAGQRTLEAQQELEKVRYESQQTVIRAESEVKALKLQRSISPEELLAQRRLELQRRAIDKWDGHLPQTTAQTPFLGHILGGD